MSWLCRMCVNLSSYNYLGFGGVDESGSPKDVLGGRSRKKWKKNWSMDHTHPYTSMRHCVCKYYTIHNAIHIICSYISNYNLCNYIHNWSYNGFIFQIFIAFQDVKLLPCWVISEVLHPGGTQSRPGVGMVKQWNPCGSLATRQVIQSMKLDYYNQLALLIDGDTSRKIIIL